VTVVENHREEKRKKEKGRETRGEGEERKRFFVTVR